MVLCDCNRFVVDQQLDQAAAVCQLRSSNQQWVQDSPACTRLFRDQCRIEFADSQLAELADFRWTEFADWVAGLPAEGQWRAHSWPLPTLRGSQRQDI